MLKFLADENLDGPLIRALVRAVPGLDLLRAKDVGLGGEPDEKIVEWAAIHGRILLTHDVRTFSRPFYLHLLTGSSHPGVILIPKSTPRGIAISDLLLAAQTGEAADFADQVTHIPFRR